MRLERGVSGGYLETVDVAPRGAPELAVIWLHGLGAEVEASNVVPRAHLEAVVDRDGPDRRVRKHEAHGEIVGQLQLRHDRHEVVAVGAQAVQPDHGGLGLAGGLKRHGVFGFADFHGAFISKARMSPP